MVHLLVVRRVSQQQALIVRQEAGGVGSAIIPQQNNPAARTEDALELGAAAGAIEPVKGLAGGDKINALVWQCGRFRRRRDAGEARASSQQALACLAHFAIGLDAEDAVAVFSQKKLRQDAGAGTDVGNDGLGSQRTIRL